MTANQTSAKNQLVDCACGNVTFVSFGKDEKLPTCRATTSRVFAPGHDARLKGQLIRHGIAGDQVRMASGEVVSVEWFAAAHFGFGDMVADGIRKGTDRAMSKAMAKASKAVTKTAPVEAPTSQTVTAKVGRWEYTGTLFTGAATADGEPVFRYTDKKGNQVDTHKFTQI